MFSKTVSELRFMRARSLGTGNGLIVQATVSQAHGHAKRVAAKAMIGKVHKATPKLTSPWERTNDKTRANSRRSRFRLT